MFEDPVLYVSKTRSFQHIPDGLRTVELLLVCANVKTEKKKFLFVRLARVQFCKVENDNFLIIKRIVCLFFSSLPHHFEICRKLQRLFLQY